VTADQIRTLAAAAAIPAIAVVLAHLAWDWNGTASAFDRRETTFTHGVALAAILGGVLAAGRFALAREPGETRTPVSDAVAAAGTIAVLAHMAWVWKDEGMTADTVGRLVLHGAVLAAIFAATRLAGRRERQWWANRARL
jgi:hypothetical protein